MPINISFWADYVLEVMEFVCRCAFQQRAVGYYDVKSCVAKFLIGNFPLFTFGMVASVKRVKERSRILSILNFLSANNKAWKTTEAINWTCLRAIPLNYFFFKFYYKEMVFILELYHYMFNLDTNKNQFGYDHFEIKE